MNEHGRRARAATRAGPILPACAHEILSFRLPKAMPSSIPRGLHRREYEPGEKRYNDGDDDDDDDDEGDDEDEIHWL